MANQADVEIRLSGGAANTDPAAALGGAISTAAGGRVLSQSASGIGTLTGVTIDDAMGNNAGVGSLFFDQSAGTLRWTPPGGSAGTPVVVSSNGEYAIQGGNSGGILCVTVVAASLPSADVTSAITIANQLNKIFDDVSKAEALAGDTEYRGLYFKNAHASDAMVNIKLWMQTNTQGEDTVQLALADEAKNTTIETIANENTAPSGPDFTAANPIDYSSGLAIPDLSAGDYKGFWVRRVVPAGVTTAVSANAFRLGYRVYV